MDQDSLNKAVAAADKVLEENFVLTPPVKIEEIIKNYGLRAFNAPFEGELSSVAGYIKPDDPMPGEELPRSATIYVSSADSANRKAFTVAHELGHWLLHRDKIKEPQYAVLYRRPIGVTSDPLEKEANAFAAHLLVPKKLLDQYPDAHDEINVMAKIFGVSSEVIGYRLQDEYAARST